MHLNHSVPDYDNGTSAHDRREVLSVTVSVDFAPSHDVLPLYENSTDMRGAINTALKANTPERIKHSHHFVGPTALVKIQFRSYASIQPILLELSRIGEVHVEFPKKTPAAVVSAADELAA